MAAAPDPLATLLGGGQLLIGPAGALYLARALAAAQPTFRHNGTHPPADYSLLRRAVDQAACEAYALANGTVDHASSGSTEFRTAADRAGSGRSDYIGTREAAGILGCSERYVRTMCRNGAFSTARRRGRRWDLARPEVAARTLQHARTAPPDRESTPEGTPR
jgi:hypothetical protein